MVIRDTQGAGLVVLEGGSAVSCTHCSVIDNTHSGVLVQGATLTLDDCEISDTTRDGSEGGGFGLNVNAFAVDGSTTIVQMDNSTITSSDLAAVRINGPTPLSVQITGSELEAGVGLELKPGLDAWGQAVVVQQGPGIWDGANGVLLEANTIRGGLDVAVLLQGASASFGSNTWVDNDIDVAQERCDAVATPVGIESVPTTELCPFYERILSEEPLRLYLSEVIISE
jgi:hypothetical protein